MSERVFQTTAPAEPGSLAGLRAFVTEVLAGRPEAFVDCVVLAVDEACSNIVRHRRPELGCRDIDLTVVLTDDRLQCRIGAFCAKSDLPRIRPRVDEPDEPGGLGTHFIACSMDRVEFVPDDERPGVLVLVLEKRLPSGDPS